MKSFISRTFLLIVLCLAIVALRACLGDSNKPYYGDYSQQP
jgi:hypothetical protein